MDIDRNVFINYKVLTPLFCILFIASVLNLCGGTSSEAESSINHMQTVLWKIPNNMKRPLNGYDWQLQFTPDGKRFILPVRIGCKEAVIDNGIVVGEYDKIEELKFSRGSSKLIYIGRTGNDHVVGIDRKTSPAFEKIKLMNEADDGSIIAFVGERNNKDYLVINNDIKTVSKSIKDLKISSNGKRIVYVRENEGSVQLVDNGVPGRTYSRIVQIAISSDGTHLAYSAVMDDRWSIVKDGTEGPRYDVVYYPKFSPDGMHFAYTIKSGNKFRVVLDGIEHPQFDKVLELVFSPDSRNLAYGAIDENRAFMVLNGRKGPLFDSVDFTAYFTDSGMLMYNARDERKEFLVYGEKAFPISDKSRICSEINTGEPGRFNAPDYNFLCLQKKSVRVPSYADDIQFSSDNEAFVYIAYENNHRCVFINGRKGAPFFDINELSITPLGHTVAYIGEQEGQYYLVCNNDINGPFDLLKRYFFSQDSRRIEFGAMKNREIIWNVIQLFSE